MTKSVLRRVSRLLLVYSIATANLVALTILWLVCLSTRVSPVEHPYIALAGLAFPVVLLVNVLFVIPWLIVSRRWLLMPVIGIALCWSYVKDYFPVNFTEHPDDGDYIKVLSFNVFNFNTTDDMNGFETAEYVVWSDADIICLQEYNAGCNAAREMEARLDSAGYEIVKGNMLLIAAKGQIITTADYEGTPHEGNGILTARVVMHSGDTIFACTAHLESTGLSIEDRSAYQEAIADKDRHKLKASGMTMLHKLAASSAERARQAMLLDSVAVSAEIYPTIVCGDMNETPVSYVAQLLSRRLTNAYTESGNGIGVSFRGKAFPVRIDHIFVSDEFEPMYSYVDQKTKSSDHHPIVTFLRRVPNLSQ